MILSFMMAASLQAQTLGGDAAFHFLKLPSSPLLAAAGGVNISNRVNDVGFSINNPALLQPALHAQISTSFTQLPAGIKGFSLAGAVYDERLQTTFAGNVFYLNYGATQQNDASGNSLGNFNPADYVAQVSAGRQYLNKWFYGLSAKFIHSQYGQYSSLAIGFDAGVLYSDTAKGFNIAIEAKNMGVQMKSYAGEPEDLPFDLQLGITKRLNKAPFSFSFTLQQLHHFNLLYKDTSFNNENNFIVSNSVFNKTFNHIILATHVHIGKKLEATIGYNHLHKSELSIGNSGNGLTGFSAGFAARFEKFHVSFSRSAYLNNFAYNQLGINLSLNEWTGLGKL